ncbi:MAG TPA: tetratricopeptide repeat protein, partial [Steroidobacteraceae bacterium]|nr:tetratricopeptide repeat protein [Steroidobacteraceae bacterium]
VGTAGEAIGQFQRGSDLDPLNPLMRKYLGRALLYARRPRDAAAVLQSTIDSNPQFTGLHYELGRVLLMQGQPAAAVAAFEAEPQDSAWRLFGLPLGYHDTGRTREMQAAIGELRRQSAGSEFQLAEAYAYTGSPDEAFAWLERSVGHDPGILWVRHDPQLDAIRPDPRFAALLKRLKMPPDAGG